MAGTTRRGYSPEDERIFTGPALEKVMRAAEDLYTLLNRGYPVKGSSTFIGNHYLLSERQRTAIVRAVSSRENLAARRAKELRREALAGQTVNIDGFNTIITLEVALSGSPVIRCMDGVYRDLAGLRGTYRLIDKTETSVRLILDRLRGLGAGRAAFWLDAPVSNSGRLKALIAEIAEEMRFDTDIGVAGGVDKTLCGLSNVISGDSVILDQCHGWFNLCGNILQGIEAAWIVDLEGTGCTG